ncbi:MAG: DUF4157 domain-containing protein [Chitinophagaceae bacterium]|nr:DUF4157 domain-containing protein [Chitinophagaceae bacterium]
MDAYNKYSFVSKRPGNLQAGAASSVGENSIPIADNRTVTSMQRKQNNTGLPDILKSRIENLSGYSMDDVKVHYNSAQPAQLNAHAHAQGTDIHIAPGQEKHLPHEAWHVVQQKQGRVKPTLQMKGKVNVNDDTGLEKEADIMGGEALRMNTQDFVLQGKFFDRFRRVINSNKGIRQFVREAKTPGIDPAKRAAKSNEGHAGNRIRDELLEHKGFRKLNRISGQINQIGGMAPVSAALNAAIGAINAGPNPVDYAGIGALYDPVKAASVVVLDAAIALDPLPPLVGDQCLLLGTLDYWATNGHLSAEIPPKTEALRWKMQQRARMSIVAHRGMGATNKSFGGLIPDADPSRARKTENSGGAFATALAHASTPVQPWGLDGIECDVFLSQDGVPIVSHDGNISEQMSAARRVAFANPGATIGTTTAAALMALERRQQAIPPLLPENYQVILYS